MKEFEIQKLMDNIEDDLNHYLTWDQCKVFSDIWLTKPHPSQDREDPVDVEMILIMDELVQERQIQGARC